MLSNLKIMIPTARHCCPLVSSQMLSEETSYAMNLSHDAITVSSKENYCICRFGDCDNSWRCRIAFSYPHCVHDNLCFLKQTDLHHGLHNHAPTMPKTRIHRLNQVPVSLMRGYLSDLPGSLGSALLDTSRRNSCSNGPFGTIVLLPGIPPDSEVPQSWVQLTIVC